MIRGQYSMNREFRADAQRSEPRVTGPAARRATEINFQRLYKIKFVFLGKGSGAQSLRSLNKSALYYKSVLMVKSVFYACRGIPTPLFSNKGFPPG